MHQLQTASSVRDARHVLDVPNCVDEFICVDNFAEGDVSAHRGRETDNTNSCLVFTNLETQIT